MKTSIAVLMVLIAVKYMLLNIVNAGGNHNHTINLNELTEVTNVNQTTITTGVSDKDLAEALAGAAASGSHQFDYSTQDYQASITGSIIDSQDAVSFGLAKRWEKVDALFHGSYTRVLNSDEHLWIVGGTFRF